MTPLLVLHPLPYVKCKLCKHRECVSQQSRVVAWQHQLVDSFVTGGVGILTGAKFGADLLQKLDNLVVAVLLRRCYGHTYSEHGIGVLVVHNVKSCTGGMTLLGG